MSGKREKRSVGGGQEEGGRVSSREVKGWYNVVVVDWSALCAGPWYSTAVGNSQVCGDYLALFLDYLIDSGMPLSNLHVIGFSLGAEVAGFTGRAITSGKLPRITESHVNITSFLIINKLRRITVKHCLTSHRITNEHNFAFHYQHSNQDHSSFPNDNHPPMTAINTVSLPTINNLNRITGLDPAYPEYGRRNALGRLNTLDAEFVDVIHTDSGQLGFPNPIGHIDFFPNGGRRTQPGCDMVTLLKRGVYEEICKLSQDDG
uniref:(California timema) hypothetical protein n=1 Tax=Timema californicum TaxID=61474 RepID=A0A7R9P8A8_TIMCA|nr:unnamed protein product [Timema californicum]